MGIMRGTLDGVLGRRKKIELFPMIQGKLSESVQLRILQGEDFISRQIYYTTPTNASKALCEQEGERGVVIAINFHNWY